MLQSLEKRYPRDDEAFTLIELMVVVLIIAILLAIAVPTFLGARDRPNDRAAQSSLRNALTAAKTMSADSQDYASANTVTLVPVEPGLTYGGSHAPSTRFKHVSVWAGTAPSTARAGAGRSKSGSCFFIRDSTTAGTTYATDTVANCFAFHSASYSGSW